MDDLLATSDIVSLHCFLDESTNDLINAASIAKMKDGVIIINCARGEIVNTVDIAEALSAGKVGGYGADVMDGGAGNDILDGTQAGVSDETGKGVIPFPARHEITTCAALDQIVSVIPEQKVSLWPAVDFIVTKITAQKI